MLPRAQLKGYQESCLHSKGGDGRQGREGVWQIRQPTRMSRRIRVMSCPGKRVGFCRGLTAPFSTQGESRGRLPGRIDSEAALVNGRFRRCYGERWLERQLLVEYGLFFHECLQLELQRWQHEREFECPDVRLLGSPLPRRNLSSVWREHFFSE